jgi:hypothetical protein
MQVYKKRATPSYSTSSKKEYELKNPLLLDVTMVANKYLFLDFIPSIDNQQILFIYL